MSFNSETITLQEQSVFVFSLNSCGTDGNYFVKSSGIGMASSWGAMITLQKVVRPPTSW